MNDRFLVRAELKFAPEAETPGLFEGYGAVFGNEDAYGDVIVPGAFKKSLKDWRAQKRTPPMLLQHGSFFGPADDLVPIGVWDDLVEDEKGLYVKGRLLALDTDRGKSIYAAMQAGALDGLSIGYRAKEFSLGTKPGEPARTLKAIDLVEVSVVTFPANADARVESVKSGLSMTEREFERFLRDAGFAREDAKTIVAHGWKALKREVEAQASQATLVAELQALARRMAPTARG